jgi:2-dehydro-3-deoxygluconokinase
MTLRVAAIGECMLEVACVGDGMFSPAQLGFGGDTLNTALYLARQGVAVDYHTALGDDRSSDAMIGAWHDEGIGVEHVERVVGASPGLYLVRTDAHGERSFQFWREHSPARRLCVLPNWAQRARKFATYDWLYFSAITLSILGKDGRTALLEAVADARAHGARVAFDSNYRPRHWPDARTAQRAIEAALRHVDLALPTFDDEHVLFGDAHPEECLARLRAHGVETAAIKLGADGCLLNDRHGSRRIAAPRVERVVDTTAAGDAFNAGFLGGLILGDTAERAALRGHRIAGIVIQHRGAIAPKTQMLAALSGAATASARSAVAQDHLRDDSQTVA